MGGLDKYRITTEVDCNYDLCFRLQKRVFGLFWVSLGLYSLEDNARAKLRRVRKADEFKSKVIHSE